MRRPTNAYRPSGAVGLAVLVLVLVEICLSVHVVKCDSPVNRQVQGPRADVQ